MLQRNRKYLSLVFFIALMVGVFSFRASMRPRLGAKAIKTMATLAPTDIAKSEIVTLHPAYEVMENNFIEEYGVRAVLYSHKKSGAQVMSVIAPDENKVFGITFRTPPSDSTGIPHILEHSVLCGSKKFPVKEPFVDLLKGSLQNFLNAFTYPDRTCYPVASTNTKDFYNLMHVYLDAVLNPRAIEDPLVLQQEGWHYELEDKSQPLTYKGVVYNEMKGVYSSPDSLLGRATQQALFPDNTYGVDSGGDPISIPDLTFEQFKGFHSSYYHPGNSRVFFYGNDDPEKRLSLLDEYLKEFDKIDVDSTVKYQAKNLKPKKLEVKFPVAPGTEPKHMVTVNWLLNDKALSPKDMLALGVLDSLLLGTSSSILRKTLTESQLGESVTGGGLSDELLQATFSVGLKGVLPENKEKVESLVMDTLKNIADSGAGFEKDAVEAALNTMEFRLREFNTGSFPRGLSMMLGMMSQWIYDKAPVDGIRFETALKGLKDDLAAGKPVFQDLLKEYVISNDHRVTVEMNPDAKVEEDVAQAEVSLLAKIKESLADKDLEKIIEETKTLKAAQLAEDSLEARATIPRLTLSDIDPKVRELPIKVVQDGRTGDHDGVSIVTHDVPSNGILYMDLGLDFSKVKEEDLPYLPLFTRMLTEAGTKSLDSVALSRKIGAETGGIGATAYTDLKSGSDGKVVDGDDTLLYFMIRGKATKDKIPVMLDLMQDVLHNANLDNQKRAVEMLKESKVRKQTSVITNGHSYGAARLAARYSFLGWYGEMTGGLSSVRDAGKMLDAAENNWSEVEARLIRIREAIVRKGGVVVNLSADEETLGAALSAVPTLLDTLPAPSAAVTAQEDLMSVWKATKTSKLLPAADEGFVVPSQVNYVCKGGPIYNPGETVSGASTVVSRYLSTGYLWDNVRVVGGAYGGFARFSEATGRFSFMSYRDPNLVNTLNIYDGAADAVAAAAEELKAHPEELTMSVIGAVGDLDSPMSPDQKGFSSLVEWLTGETTAERQRYRDEVLGASPADFTAFAEKLSGLKESGGTVVFGSQAALEQANTELPEGKKLTIENAITDN